MKRPILLRTVFTAVALCALCASVTKAYTIYGEWGTLNVSFHVNPANLDVSANAAITAVQAGMNAWNTQSGTAFRFGYAGQTGITTAGDDGKNVVVFRNSTNGGTIASTYAWSSGGLLREADIVFWDASWKFFTGSAGCSSGAYIEDIATHELGHALGLQHSSVADATMNGSYSSCSTGMRTLAADDIAGARALYANGPGVPDTPPTVRILTPANGATVSSTATINFSGSATDTTDGDISSDLTWRSNISGQIGTGAVFSRTLPAGVHTISTTVVDSGGYTITQAIVVTVTSGSPTNTAPTVTITSPANGATVVAGTSITFSGSAADTQQGNLTTSLVWRSNLDGQIGTGGSVTRALTAGTHTITATVTDSGGLTGQRSITVSVTAAAPPPSHATLSARAYKVQGLQKVDLTWSGIVATNIDVYRNSAKITTTPNDGAMTDAVDKNGNGSHIYKVCAAGTTTCSNQVTVTF